MFRNTFTMRDNYLIPLSLGDQIQELIICFAIHLQSFNIPKPRRPGVKCTTSDFVCTSCSPGVQENVKSVWSYSNLQRL